MGCGILGISRLKDTSIFGTILIYPLFLVEGCFFASLVLHNTCSLVERKKKCCAFVNLYYNIFPCVRINEESDNVISIVQNNCCSK